jgi:predicted transcriptional regulator of viral defense system
MPKQTANGSAWPLSNGIYRTRDLTARGLSRSQVIRLAGRGELIRLARGLYTTPATPIETAHTLAEVCMRAPRGVICLMSALQFHNLTTQNPWRVCLLLERGVHTPRIAHPALWVFRTGPEAFALGIEEHVIEGVVVRVTGIAKTIVDCFKYRNRVGLDVALEALRECLRSRTASVTELLQCARICRVERVMRPYIEAMVEATAA